MILTHISRSCRSFKIFESIINSALVICVQQSIRIANFRLNQRAFLHKQILVDFQSLTSKRKRQRSTLRTSSSTLDSIYKFALLAVILKFSMMHFKFIANLSGLSLFCSDIQLLLLCQYFVPDSVNDVQQNSSIGTFTKHRSLQFCNISQTQKKEVTISTIMNHTSSGGMPIIMK